MTASPGRTYRVQIDVIAEEYVTILENGDLVLEDAVTGDFMVVERSRLDDFANSEPPYSAHVAERIHQVLLSPMHDDCNWPWTQQLDGGWWYRHGKCPTCGEW
ncbi:hypothetical protein ACTU6V_13440 [Microbacterium sp. A204]|uniref:hypothetical protein n=1 Tax=Microbacterium sp. A204 TaxID=3457321 RepID=UPI003FD2E0CB